MRTARHNGPRVSQRITAFVFALVFATSLAIISRSSADAGAKSRRVPNHVQTGIASFYADEYHGKTTASGEIFDMHELTAAHRTYPFGTIVRVTRLGSNQSVEARINDRGPFVSDRIIDLSLAAASKLDIVQIGIAEVKVELLNGAPGRDSSSRSFRPLAELSARNTGGE